MKSNFRLLFSAALVLFLNSAYAQISTFPYTQDFESFTTQTSSSCNTQAGVNASGWTQMTGDDGSWRADQGGTPSVGTGPGSTETTSGIGVGRDANPGTTGGIYLFTEASGCPYTEVGMLSPSFDFSAQDTFYRMKFSYNMYGFGIGSLHVDVYDNGSWYNDIWVQEGPADSGWHVAVVNLAGYNSSNVQLRFRGITGGSFTSDICFDNVIVEQFTPPSYDALLSFVDYSPQVYPIITTEQLDSVEFTVKVKNEGLYTAHNVRASVTVDSYSDTLDFDSLLSYSTESLTTSSKFLSGSTGEKQIRAIVHIDESDSFAYNDTFTTSFIHSDSVLARENGSYVAGYGWNGNSGLQGQMFELYATDTLTTVSFYATGDPNDQAKVHVFAYDTAPGISLMTSGILTLTGNRQWYTVGFSCPKVLTAGKYFVAVEQMSQNTMMLGVSSKGYEPRAARFKAATVNAWTDLETQGDFCYMIRMNFGEVDLPDLAITAPDSVCEGSPFNVRANGAFRYQWRPKEAFENPSYSLTSAALDSSLYIAVTGTNACGLEASVEHYIEVAKGPTVVLSPDTTACVGDQINLTATTTNNYQWSNGVSNSSLTVQILSDTVFSVTVDTNNGCSRTFDIEVESSTAEVKLEALSDTVGCEGYRVRLAASEAESYSWSTGQSTDTVHFNPLATGTVRVSGYNSFGCEAVDSILLEVLENPDLVSTGDTGVCFGDSLYLRASGADSLQWTNGPSGMVYPIKFLKAQDYIIEAYNNNGCSLMDTITVSMLFPPIAELPNDTIICEDEPFTIQASGGDSYLWSTGDTTSSIEIVIDAPEVFSVRVSLRQGCSDEASIRLDVDPLPVAGFSFKSYQDSIAFTNRSTLADSYSWDFGDGSTSTEMSPGHVYENSGTYDVKLTAFNDCGAVDSVISIEVTVPTGSMTPSLLSGLTLYPVPTQRILSFKLSNTKTGRLEYVITDMSGRQMTAGVVRKQEWTVQAGIDVSDLASGAYYITFKMGDASVQKKVIKH